MRFGPGVALLAGSLTLAARAEDPMPSRDFMPEPVQLAASFEIFDTLLTPDGKYLVTASQQRYGNYEKRQVTQSAITLWDVEAGKVVRVGNLEAPYNLYDRGVGPRVVDLAFGADGRSLLVYMDTRFVEVLSFPELVSQAVIDVKKAFTHFYRTGALSPDGAWLALGDENGEVALWSLAERALVKTWEAHDKVVTTLAFASGGAVLATGGNDDAVRLWSIPKGKELREIDDLEGSPSRLEFSPDGASLAIASAFKNVGGKVRVWSVPRKRFVAEKQCTVMIPVVRFAYSPDGKRLAYGCSTWMEEGTSLVRVLDIDSGKLPAVIHRQTMTQAVVFLPDGRLLTAQKNPAGGQAYQSIAVWTLDPPKFLKYLHDPAAKPGG